MSVIGNALRIAFDSFAYRIRKREANNLAVTASMLVAFGIPLADAALRALIALLLNMYIYLINDYCDIWVDLASPQKDGSLVSFRSAHRQATVLALGLEALALVGLAGLHWTLYASWLLPVALAANTVIIFAYSQWLKRIPVADVLIMAVAGASTTMVGVPGTRLGLALLGLFALLCAGYQVIQLIRDYPEDERLELTTSAVFLGPARAAILFRLLALGSAVYGWWVVGSPICLPLALGVFFPLDVARAERAWDFARMLFGTVWLGLLGQIFFAALR